MKRWARGKTSRRGRCRTWTRSIGPRFGWPENRRPREHLEIMEREGRAVVLVQAYDGLTGLFVFDSRAEADKPASMLAPN